MQYKVHIQEHQRQTFQVVLWIADGHLQNNITILRTKVYSGNRILIF